MTDQEKLLALFADLGLEPHIKNDKEGVTAVRLRQGYPKVDGYSRFYCDFNFDSAGKFIDAGVWE